MERVVPALVAWVVHTDLLATDLVPDLLHRALATLKACPAAQGYHRTVGADPRRADEEGRSKASALYHFIIYLKPLRWVSCGRDRGYPRFAVLTTKTNLKLSSTKTFAASVWAQRLWGGCPTPC
eukprot:1184017-Prorocentrum_minimum.AAC.2